MTVLNEQEMEKDQQHAFTLEIFEKTATLMDEYYSLKDRMIDIETRYTEIKNEVDRVSRERLYGSA